MKKNIFLLTVIFFFFHGLGFSEEVKKNGLIMEYYESGALKAEWNYKDDQLHGKYLSYYNTGQLEVEGYFEKDENAGISRRYYENGNLLWELEYKDNTMIRQTIYDPSGNPVPSETQEEKQKTAEEKEK